MLHLELQTTHWFSDLHFIMFPDTDSDVRELKVLPTTASISSKALGQFIILPCSGRLNFKYLPTDGNSNNQDSSFFNLEALSTSAINRIVEMYKIKNQPAIQ